MFGKNERLPPVRSDGMSLLVKEIFPTIQGEGPNAGLPSIFVRLAGCNLSCSFCDTAFENGYAASVFTIVDSVKSMDLSEWKFVVLTGGEPMRQNVGPLVLALITAGYRVQVETSGSISVPWTCPASDDIAVPSPHLFQVVVSPKTPDLHRDFLQGGRFYGNTVCWKYVVSAGVASAEDGLPVGVRRPDYLSVWVMPMDEQNEDKNWVNLQTCARIAMRHGYRLGVQVHKLLGMR